SLLGTITDGDIRRAIVKKNGIAGTAVDVMNNNPITFLEGQTASEIIEKLPLTIQERNQSSRSFIAKVIIVNSQNVPIRLLDYHELWEQKVATHRHIVVVGLGYVGLTLALALADEGFYLSGYDVDANKIAQLKKGNCYIHEIGLPELLLENVGKTFHPTAELPANGDVYIISVGTPVVAQGKNIPAPILDYLDASVKEIGKKLDRGNLVVLRSTVPIGTCREFVIPKLEEASGLKCGLDFHVSFAPERTAEGKAIKELRELPQIIGGYNQDAVEATVAVFRELTSTIVRVESLEAAEMIKLVNNSFRDYVFAFANELSVMASKFNIDVVEAIKSANKGYPRNPIPLPSPGVGGPCLTKDPYIFANVAHDKGMDGQVFIKGRYINEFMHPFIVSRLKEQLGFVNKSVQGANVLICGLAFKGYPETGDIRNSSSVEVYNLLKKEGVNIFGYDPVAIKEDLEYFEIKEHNVVHGFKGFDAVLFLNNHKSFEKLNVYTMLREMNEKPIFFDGWSAFHKDDILNARESVYMNLSATYNSIIKK
ncbi:MAG: nucleotide sugar dehydrogenase, partial [Bacteroidetes bacterium]|nr:nucleotide sugar dehydrogenase [Bacteroidota bacterium]